MQNIKQATIFAFLLLICNYTVADEKVKLKDRWGFHTNVIEWVMTTPNIGVEYDVIHRDTRKTSIMLSGKYNWNFDHEYNASNSNRYIYNNLGLKAELRFYFRTRSKDDWEDKLLKNKDIDGFYNKFFIRKGLLLSKDKPRTYRAYYLAPYISYDKFSLKFGETGKQGTATSVGISFGYNTPLYLYNNGHAIDFELGASVGFVYTGYDKFKYNKEDACYTLKSEKSGHLVPFPMITGVRMGFVYRFNSIREQLKTYDRTSLDQLKNMYELNIKYNEAMAKYSDSSTAYYISPDSVVAWNKHVKEQNIAIQKSRDLYSAADSASLPIELAYAYEYLELPKNGFSKYIRKQLPNKRITSISELDNDYLNSIVKKYSGIKDENSGDGNFNVTIESPETALMIIYESERATAINETGDSTAAIPMLSYLIKAIDRVNDQSIRSHNKKYFIDKKGYDESIIAKVSRIKNTVDDTPKRNLTISFLSREDTLYMKKAEGYELKGMNAEIEMYNKIKMAKLQNDAALQRAMQEKEKAAQEAQKTSEEKDKKAKKNKKSKKDAETVATPQAAEESVVTQEPVVATETADEATADAVATDTVSTDAVATGETEQSETTVEDAVAESADSGNEATGESTEHTEDAPKH